MPLSLDHVVLVVLKHVGKMCSHMGMPATNTFSTHTFKSLKKYIITDNIATSHVKTTTKLDNIL